MKLLDRVTVTTIKTEDWQSVHSLINGYVAEIYPDRVKVIADQKSTHTGFMAGGVFYFSAYKITPNEAI
jgi:hypothetical protein